MTVACGGGISGISRIRSETPSAAVGFTNIDSGPATTRRPNATAIMMPAITLGATARRNMNSSRTTSSLRAATGTFALQRAAGGSPRMSG